MTLAPQNFLELAWSGPPIVAALLGSVWGGVKTVRAIKYGNAATNGPGRRFEQETVAALTKIGTVLDAQTTTLAKLNASIEEHDRRVAPAMDALPRMADALEGLGRDFDAHESRDDERISGLNRRLDEMAARRR